MADANNQNSFLDYAGLALFWNNIKKIIEDNELVTATALTNLDTRVNTLEEEAVVQIISKTYSELKALRDNSQLVPGQQYRIIDYTCTTSQSGTKSAGHVFDIIVTADDESTLNEVARAVKHEGDSYFDGCNLNAWKIWYCLDNDTDRFAWAIIGELIGTIKPTTGGSSGTYTYNSSISKIMFSGIVHNLEVGVRTQIAYGPPVYVTKTDNYTLVVEGPLDYVNTLGGISVYTVSQEGKGVIYRMIDEFDNDVPYDFKNIQFKHPNDTTTYPYYYYTFASDNVEDNTDYSLDILKYCHSNIIRGYINKNNKRQLNCIIFIGTNCHSNSFGSNCYNNSFGSNSYNNSFGSGCFNNSFKYSCTDNSFGNSCYNNNFSGGCAYNSFGNKCFNNSFGNNCCKNSFGNYCTNNSFGKDCSSNSFGNDCSYNSFRAIGDITGSAISNCRYNTFDDGCSYNIIYSANTSDSAYLENYHINRGVKGTYNKYMLIDAQYLNSENVCNVYRKGDVAVVSYIQY